MVNRAAPRGALIIGDFAVYCRRDADTPAAREPCMHPESSPRARLARARLYGILDLGYVAPTDVERVAEQMCAGGVDLLQLRAKGLPELEIERLAVRVEPITAASGIPLILNDFPELVPSMGAQGAHVGQDDLPVAEARWRAGRSLAGDLPAPIIGKSTHSLAQAVAAAEEGADYIGFGPLFPIFCIGGIKRENLEVVLAAGARRVVIVSGILQTVEIAGYCREVKGRLGEII